MSHKSSLDTAALTDVLEGQLPSLAKEGRTRHQENSPFLLKARPGWLVLRPIIGGGTNHPGCAASAALRPDRPAPTSESLRDCRHVARRACWAWDWPRPSRPSCEPDRKNRQGPTWM